MTAPVRPDSVLAETAERLLRASAPRVLVEHCLHTHAFAVALLDVAGRSYDAEHLFVAAGVEVPVTRRIVDDLRARLP